MSTPRADVLVVFGHGVRAGTDGFVLTAASLARVRAAARYVTGDAGGARARVVFTGGWPAVRAGTGAPPAGWREGDLMLAEAVAAGLDRHADLHTETRSRSTLENLVHIRADGLIDPRAFDGHRPLGLVSHAWHLPRVRYLAGKVLGLRGAALLDVPATGGDRSTRWPYRGGAHVGSRLLFLGARDAARLLRRERMWAAAMRRGSR